MKVFFFFLFEILLFLTVRGTFAGFESCDFDKCQNDDLAEGLSRVNFLPNEQQLRELCPKTLQQVACLVQEAESCTGKTIEELASIADPTFAKIITGARGLIQDICDENSQFRKDYLESRDCFRGFIRVGARHCSQEADSIVDILMEPSDKPDDDYEDSRRQCLSATHMLTCLVLQLEDTCGERAQKVFLDTVVRFGDLFLAICDDKETATEVRAMLFDYLELEGDTRSKMETALSYLNRRRR